MKYVEVLIPYAIRNKINVGFAKFSKEIDLRIRHIITGEVNRRIALATKGVDTSIFAQYPTSTVHIGKFNLELDKIGEIVLQEELKRYNQKYTVGVQEALIDSSRYKKTLERAQSDSVGSAFQTNCVSYRDLNFKGQESLTPSFLVDVPELSSSVSLPVRSIRNNIIEIIVPSKSLAETGLSLSITLPSSYFTEYKEVVVYATLERKTITDNGKSFVAICKLDSEQMGMSVESFNKSIERHIFSNPMACEQEKARTTHAVMRDIVFASSPWLPVYIQKCDKNLYPHSVITSNANKETFDAIISRELLVAPGLLVRVVKELIAKSECYIFASNTSSGSPFEFAATLDELERTDLLSTFLSSPLNKNLEVIHCRLGPIDKKLLERVVSETVTNEFVIAQVTKLLTCIMMRVVTNDIKYAFKAGKETLPKFPVRFHINDSGEEIRKVKVFDVNHNVENVEPRYEFSKPVMVKSGMLTKLRATTVEISDKGMLIELSAPLPSKFKNNTVQISMPDIGLPWTKFKVVSYAKSEAKLQVETANNQRIKAFKSLIEHNKSFFHERDLVEQNYQTFKCLWEIGTRANSSVAAFVNAQNTTKVYQAFKPTANNSYMAFHENNKNFSLYALLADKKSSKPRSGVLSSLLSNGGESIRGIVEWQMHSGAFVQVRDAEFKAAATTNKASDIIGSSGFSYTQITANRITGDGFNMISSKYVHLATIDINSASSVKKRLKEFSHVLYLISMARLHKSCCKF